MGKLTRGFAVMAREALGLRHVLVLLPLMAAGCQKPAPEASVLAAQSSAGAPIVPADGQEQSGGSLADRLKAVQSGQADKAAKAQLPAWKPVRPGAVAPTIPLGKGLVVVMAVSQPVLGDYEAITTVSDVSSSEVLLTYAPDIPPPKVVDVADVQHAHGFAEYIEGGKAEHFPGATAISASTEVLSQLHAGSQVEFHSAADPLSGWMQLGAQVLGQKNEGPTITPYAGMPMFACTCTRWSPRPSAYRFC